MNALSQRGEPATAPAGATLPKWAVGRRARQPPAGPCAERARMALEEYTATQSRSPQAAEAMGPRHAQGAPPELSPLGQLRL
jgi:hypothetical protein